MTGGIISDFRRYNLSRKSFAFLLWRNEYLLRKPAIVRDDKADAALFLIAAHHLLMSALQHFYHLAFQAAAPIFSGDLHQHLVSVKDEVHLTRTEVNILPFCQRHGKAIAVPMPLHPAMQQVHLVHQAIGAPAIDH